MTTDLVLVIGIMMTVGLLSGLAAKRLEFPRITGYIIVGILLSPSILNLVPRATIENLDIITYVALGIIAYSIGGSLRLESIRKLGRSIAWITPFQSLGAWLIVTLVIAFLAPFILATPNATFLQFYFPMAFVIGAMACATAPAATMAIIQEYKAKGPLTTTLLTVVALDDAVAVIAFAIALGIAQPLVSRAGDISLYQMLGIPFLHIVESLGIGVVFGFALIYIAKLARTRALLLLVVLGTIMLCIGVTNLLGISLILANMVVGFIVANKGSKTEPFIVIEEIEDVVFVIFFVMAGMHFDLSVMKVAGILALLIVAGRFTGKYFGARAGAKISHAPETVKKYLGLALLPKAGVTIGLALLAERAFPTFGAIILNGVLASVIINELVAPPLAKYGIFKAGEQMRGETVSFSFPSQEIATLLVGKLLGVFESEGFYVSLVDMDQRLYQMRTGNVILGFRHFREEIVFDCDIADVPLVNAVMYEVLVDLEKTIKELQKPIDRQAIGRRIQIPVTGVGKEFKLSNYLTPSLVEPDLRGNTKREIIAGLLDIVQQSDQLRDIEEARKAIWDREESMSTGMQYGIAIPHGRTDAVKQLVCAIGVKRDGVDFGSIDGEPSRIFVLTLSPKAVASPYLQFMSTVSQILSSPEVRKRVLSCSSRKELYRVLTSGPGKSLSK